VRLLKTRRQKIEHVEFNSTGGLLAHGSDEAVYWPEPAAGNTSVKMGSRKVWSATFVRGTPLIAYSDPLGVSLFRLTDHVGWRLLGEEHRGHSITPAGKSVLILHGYSRPLLGYRVSLAGGGTELWQVPWGDPLNPWYMSTAHVPVGGGSQFVYFEFRGWGTEGSPYHLMVRKSATGEIVREWPIQMFPDGRAAVSPDDHWLAFTSANYVVILDLVVERQQSSHLLNNSDAKHSTSVAFHPSGRYLAATSNDATVKLYDTSTWTVAHTYTWNIGRMRSIAFSPDGALAAAGSDTGKIVVWDVDV
jgi:WD40 repeat protein